MKRLLAALLVLTGLITFSALPSRAQDDDDDDAPDARQSAGTDAATNPLNAKILAFVKGKMGTKVGDGECATLVNEAFESAGARRDPPFGPGQDYIWGTEITDLKKVMPGDIIQYRNATFEQRKKKGNTITVITTNYGHHTSVVSVVKKPGLAFTVLHQNATGPNIPPSEQKIVRAANINMKNLKKGKLWFFRPIAARA